MTHRVLDMPGADVTVYSAPPLGWDPDKLFSMLQHDVAWEQHSIHMYGKDVFLPRLEAWYGDHGYTYSGIHLPARPMTHLLTSLKNAMVNLTGSDYNGVLLNYYRDGNDSIGMHADDEPEFGVNPTIASLSLGAERVFKFRRKDRHPPIIKVPLIHGSVVVMAGETQANWKHGIDKTKDHIGPRINLTFRNIVNPR